MAAVPPAPMQPRVSGAPKPPAPAAPLPLKAAGRDLIPLGAPPAPAQHPHWKQALPILEPARAPRVASAPLREPTAAAPAALPLTQPFAGPESTSSRTALPQLTNPTSAAPPLAGPTDYAKIAAELIRPSNSRSKPASADVTEQISLPGPTLPHELTSLNAAGIGKIMVPAGRAAAARRGSSWAVSLVVAAAVLAATLGAAFYAMPGLASASPPASQPHATAKPAPPPEPTPAAIPSDPLARVVEVTGVRFVTDIPNRPPQIHYLVVNHSNLPLQGVTVNVTLRSTASEAPLSQFAFRAPRLGPYESKEMISTIERMDRAISLPPWQDLRTEIQVSR